MKLKTSVVPKWTPKPKQEPADSTVYITENGWRVFIVGERDPILGQEIRVVSNGHRWFYRGELRKEA